MLRAEETDDNNIYLQSQNLILISFRYVIIIDSKKILRALIFWFVECGSLTLKWIVIWDEKGRKDDYCY